MVGILRSRSNAFTARRCEVVSSGAIITVARRPGPRVVVRTSVPLGLGLVASAVVLIGKFSLDSNPEVYTGIGVLVAAAAWNAWPRRAVESCSCKILKECE